jgi:hypothetical protein
MFRSVVGRDTSVGIATRYGLNGPGIESRWGARFSTPVQTDPGAHAASYTMGTGSFPWVKRPGRGVYHPSPFSAEVKETVELHLYSSGPSWSVLGCEIYLRSAVDFRHSETIIDFCFDEKGHQTNCYTRRVKDIHGLTSLTWLSY